MTPLGWGGCFIGVSSLAELTALLDPRLAERFPFRLMRSNPGESRFALFARILGSALLFGAVVGLVGGSALLGARFIASHF
jgi:hypothetical protein